MRIGQSVDIHQLVEGRDLILGGVKIEHTKGLLGHSDADVLVHAIMESLIGAMGLGDLGKHFPDTDPKYKGISSILLLEETYKMIKKDTTIEHSIDINEYIIDNEKIYVKEHFTTCKIAKVWYINRTLIQDF